MHVFNARLLTYADKCFSMVGKRTDEEGLRILEVGYHGKTTAMIHLGSLNSPGLTVIIVSHDIYNLQCINVLKILPL